MSLSINDIILGMEANFQNAVDKKGRRVAEYPDVDIRDFSYMGYAGTNTLAFKAEAESSHPGKAYQVNINFFGQAPSRTKDNLHPFEVDINGVKWYFPTPTGNDNVALRCSCKDFDARFARVLAEHKALIGPPPVYTPKPGSNRPSVNPNRAPGVCKHLWAFIKFLDNSGLTKVR